MIADEFQRMSLAFRGLSDEEPEEGGIPEADGDLDDPEQLVEEESDGGDGKTEETE